MQLEAMAQKGLAYRLKGGAYVVVVNRASLLAALKLWRELPDRDRDRLPLKAYIKKRGVLLRLEELLPANWQRKVPPLKEGEDDT
jgi:hypothetical protein